MKPNIDTPAVTAHALGESDPATERLLRLTFASPEGAAELAQECESIRDAANSLRRAFASQPALGLTDAQRQAILDRTADPFPANRQPSAEPVGVSAVARRRYERRPAIIATLLTAGAAAAVVALLSLITSSPVSTRRGQPVETEEVARMKIVPQSKIDKMREARNRFAEARPTPLEYPLNPDLPRPTIPDSATSDGLPKGSTAKRTLPKPPGNTAAQLPSPPQQQTPAPAASDSPKTPKGSKTLEAQKLATPKR